MTKTWFIGRCSPAVATRADAGVNFSLFSQMLRPKGWWHLVPHVQGS